MLVSYRVRENLCTDKEKKRVPKSSLVRACTAGVFILNMKALYDSIHDLSPDRVAQWVGHLTRKSGVLGSIPGLATYFRFSFRFFKKGSSQLLAKVCARSTG